MVIAQLLQTYMDVSIYVSVCIKYVVCIPAYMSISPIVFKVDHSRTFIFNPFVGWKTPCSLIKQ